MKKIISVISILFIASNAFSFEWPQEDISKASYNSYFGQSVGSILSTSLTFAEPTTIKNAEDGNVLIILTDEEDDSQFFPSTLGTSVILSHEDNLLSVYGNIDKDTITIKNEKDTFLDAGATIGESGNSGYQTRKGNLEFKIIDTKNNSAINPKVLMPRSETEIPLTISGVTIQNKNGTYYDIDTYKTFTSGLYRIYYKRNPIATPYKTTVTINGVIVDQISYDTITEENNRICVAGKKKYTSSDIYPKEDLQLLGEAMFTPGRATLILSVSDILGNIKQVSYNITIK